MSKRRARSLDTAPSVTNPGTSPTQGASTADTTEGAAAKLPRPAMLALDPSLRATGWAVLDLETMAILAIGAIITKKAKKTERLLAAEDGARCGSIIRRSLVHVMRTYNVVVVCAEANGGSKSAVAAAALHRAQQACSSAVEEMLGTLPIYITPQRMQKTIVGRMTASKEDIAERVRAHWELNDFDALLSESGVTTKKAREGVYDACGVGKACWDFPTVVVARRLAA